MSPRWLELELLAAQGDDDCAVAVPPPQQEVVNVSTEERRKCVTCGSPLKKQNTSDKCYRCKHKSGEYGGAPKPRGDEAPPSTRKKREAKAPVDELTPAETREQFEMLAKGLNLDPEHLIGEFCAGWVANIKAAAESALNPEAD